MKQILLPLLLFLLMVGNMACESSDTSSNTTSSERSTAVSSPSPAPVALPERHDCQPNGEVMDGNQTWLRTVQTLVTIEADSSTVDDTFGESHRIIRAYNTSNCQLIFDETLPVNISPDYPYYLASINYNRNSQLVAIQGAKEVYLYDVQQKMLLPKLTPTFKKSPEAADAQSGNIVNLELYEKYLLGYAVDYGFFGFDLRQKANVKPLLSSAAFKASTGENALFFIESEDTEYQGLICNYDNEEANFAIRTLLEKPAKLNTEIPDNVANNRYVVIREHQASGGKLLAIDMKEGRRVDLPAEIADKQVKTVLQWLSRQ